MRNDNVKKVYFVRHGETAENAANATQTSESPLSEKGLKQAIIIARRFLKIRVDKIFSSDYKRAAETAEKISKLKRLPVEYSRLFRERLIPMEARGRSKNDKTVKKVLTVFENRNNNPDWKFSDEESWNELTDRANAALQKVEKCPQKNILVVTHGGILRMMIGAMLLKDKFNLAESRALNNFLITSNTGITLCEFRKNGRLPISGELQEWNLITWNDHAHLG